MKRSFVLNRLKILNYFNKRKPKALTYEAHYFRIGNYKFRPQAKCLRVLTFTSIQPGIDGLRARYASTD